VSDAELFLRAAAKMRERAEAAYPTPWRQDDCHVWTGNDPDPDEGPTVYVNGGVYRNQARTAEHIAAWHPGVAQVVALWLEWAAGQVRDIDNSAELSYAREVARAFLSEEVGHA
jgi:hypothetical protein